MSFFGPIRGMSADEVEVFAAMVARLAHRADVSHEVAVDIFIDVMTVAAENAAAGKPVMIPPLGAFLPMFNPNKPDKSPYIGFIPSLPVLKAARLQIPKDPAIVARFKRRRDTMHARRNKERGWNITEFARNVLAKAINAFHKGLPLVPDWMRYGRTSTIIKGASNG